MEFPIIKVEDSCFLAQIDLRLYASESIISACYKFTDRFFIHQKISSSSNQFVDVIFESKDKNDVSVLDVKQFCNELIDQQVRYNMNHQFGHIRDLIVEEAFRPVSK